MPRQLKSLTHMVANREHEQNMPDHFWVWMLEHAVLEYCVQKDVSWARTTVVRI